MTTSSSSSRTSMTREAAGELQPLLHSTSDSMIRKLVVANDTTIDMDAAQVEECDDTDSNKTEVEEIEMVDMEGRAEIVSEDEVTPLLAARHRLETRGRVIGNYGPDSGTVENSGNDGTADHHVNGDKEEGEEEEGKPGLDENGNPTSSTGPGPFPIMDPQLRPLSIYRHTPVFRPQKLTVPSMSDREQMENRQATIVDHKLESRPQEGGKRKVRRKKGGEEGSVMKAEDIEGYRGKEDIDAILSFIEAEKGGKKKKSSEKVVEKSVGKKKPDKEEKEKVRKKKEKSVEKENNSTTISTSAAKAGVGKKLSVDNSSEAEVLEEVEEEEEEEEAQTTNILEKVPLAEEERRDTLVKRSPASLASCGRANSAPSNDSGHVSAEPYSLPSVSSTKETSIASSPPLDLDPAEDLTAEDVILHSTEFTKVTKKQRRKRGAGARERNDRPHVYHQGSAFAEENRSRGEQQPRNGGQSENEDWGYRGYTRLRGSREAVTGAKSTCSVPPSDAP